MIVAAKSRKQIARLLFVGSTCRYRRWVVATARRPVLPIATSIGLVVSTRRSACNSLQRVFADSHSRITRGSRCTGSPIRNDADIGVVVRSQNLCPSDWRSRDRIAIVNKQYLRASHHLGQHLKVGEVRFVIVTFVDEFAL